MVSVDNLDCLDLLIWLGKGAAVKQRLNFSESKISRMARRVADAFEVSLIKRNGEWTVIGDTALLDLQRLVHQEYRWAMRRPLRIEAHYCSGRVLSGCLPESWIKGNFDPVEVQIPLRYLRNGIIDAWIGVFPDVPEEEDGDLYCFHLIRMPVHPVVATDHPLIALGDRVTLEDVKRYPSRVFPNYALPRFQAMMQELELWNPMMLKNAYNFDQWEGEMTGSEIVGYATQLTIDFFDRTHMLLPIQVPFEVGETLVVRREYAIHPRFEELVSDLKGQAVELQQRFPSICLCF